MNTYYTKALCLIAAFLLSATAVAKENVRYQAANGEAGYKILCPIAESPGIVAHGKLPNGKQALRDTPTVLDVPTVQDQLIPLLKAPDFLLPRPTVRESSEEQAGLSVCAGLGSRWCRLLADANRTDSVPPISLQSQSRLLLRHPKQF
jgi:hypothetical protein